MDQIPQPAAQIPPPPLVGPNLPFLFPSTRVMKKGWVPHSWFVKGSSALHITDDVPFYKIILTDFSQPFSPLLHPPNRTSTFTPPQIHHRHTTGNTYQPPYIPPAARGPKFDQQRPPSADSPQPHLSTTFPSRSLPTSTNPEPQSLQSPTPSLDSDV